MNELKPIPTALVGYGAVAAKMHAPLIEASPALSLQAVVERTTQHCAAKYPQVQTHTSLDSLLEDEQIELLVLTTPNSLHFSMAKQALLAGKHVVVDKPVTIHSHEAEELQELSQELKLLCTVFQNRRLDGDFQTVQQLLREETLGEVRYLESHFDRFRPNIRDNWREKDVPGNGITYDLGTHLVDQLVQLWGAPSAVQATIRSLRPAALADDYFSIELDYGDKLARATAGVLVNAPTPRFLLLGEKGSYQKFGLDVQEAAFTEGKLPIGEHWGKENPENWGILYLGESHQPIPTIPGDYRLFYDNCAQVIRKQASPLVQLDEAILVLKLLEAAFESSRLGKTIPRSEGGW